MAEVVERVTNLEARVVAVDGVLVRVEPRMESGFNEMRSEIRTDFRWIMGGISGAVITVILAMFARNWI